MGKQKEEAVGVDIQEELLFSQVNAPAFELSCLCYLNFLELPQRHVEKAKLEPPLVQVQCSLRSVTNQVASLTGEARCVTALSGGSF